MGSATGEPFEQLDPSVGIQQPPNMTRPGFGGGMRTYDLQPGDGGVGAHVMPQPGGGGWSMSGLDMSQYPMPGNQGGFMPTGPEVIRGGGVGLMPTGPGGMPGPNNPGLIAPGGPGGKMQPADPNVQLPTPVVSKPNGFAHADRGKNFGRAAKFAKGGSMAKAKKAIESGGGTWSKGMSKFLRGRK